MTASARAALLAMVIALPCAPLDAVAQASNPGLLFEPSFGRLSYADDSSGATRPEWKLQVGYRLCVGCTSTRSRLDIIPTIALHFTELGGSSALDTETPAVSSFDVGLGAAYGIWRSASQETRLRLRVTVERVIKATAERTVTEPEGAEFINYVGGGTMRWGAQLELVCLRLWRLGRHTLTLGGSHADGSYDHYERRGDETVIPNGLSYRSTSITLGLQSRMLRSDCR